MQINKFHLTYCTNIHAAQSWHDTFNSLQTYLPEIKKQLCPNHNMGIGLRLSADAAHQLRHHAIDDFKNWLTQQQLYVFTINGFPYGGFHNQTVKDQVYKPDWTSPERLQYTFNLIHILESMMQAGNETGISTVPLSYKYWVTDSCNTADVYEACTVQLIKCVQLLHKIDVTQNKYIHIDLEPEPDCLLQNTGDVIQYFKKFLLPYGIDLLQAELGIDAIQARHIILRHITVCFDVCHFAVVFEDSENAIMHLQNEGIKIGKVQLSAALKLDKPLNATQQWLQPQLNNYKTFAESTYLHQTVVKDVNNNLHHFRDLPEALLHFNNNDYVQWRTHFHVPVFMASFGSMQSTQDDLLQVLSLLKAHAFTQHLEIETYTWEVLPQAERLNLQASIIREMQWVLQHLA